MLALVSGMTTGLTVVTPRIQIVVLVSIHMFFLLYLEVRRPYHTPFLQKTAALVTTMKIAALGLTFFLVSSTQTDGSQINIFVAVQNTESRDWPRSVFIWDSAFWHDNGTIKR